MYLRYHSIVSFYGYSSSWHRADSMDEILATVNQKFQISLCIIGYHLQVDVLLQKSM